MKTFKSAENKYLVSFMWCITIGLAGMIFIEQPEQDTPPILIFYFIILSIVAFIAWILLYTKYTVNDHFILCYSGPLFCKIDINNVKKIEVNNDFIKPTLLKLSLSHEGFVIYYNTFDTIFISPKDKELFVKTLLEANPTIIIKY